MRKNSELTIFISCCLAMIITLLFYLLVFDNIFAIPMRWLSLLFLLMIEVAGTVKALKIDRNIFGVTNIIVSLIHILVVFGLSLLFVNLLPLLIKQYVLLNMLLFAVVAAIDIVLLYFGARAKESNEKRGSF